MQRFNYKLPTGNILLMVIVAWAVPIALAYIATTNRKGLRIVAVGLDPGEANIFYWVAAGVCAAAALVAIVVAVRAFQFPGYIELGSEAALLPRASLSQSLMAVPYAGIRGIRAVAIPGQQMLVVSSDVGEARLLSKAFASPSEYELFASELNRRVNG